ncbi:MAG TPA: carboxypeptidase regulatory-like domain-containing protein [Terriglobales bacterium]|jgi:hypothetical protein|nr:carboxypeptidase regulatory-like domain-containing protein [Terriglobales bacterium]
MRLPHCCVFVTCACALLLLCGSIPIAAQVTGGTILGTITDTSGAVVPKATVTVKNQATGLTRIVSTNQDGLYRAPNLIPGKYQVNVSATGFATDVRNEVTVDVGQELQIDLQLRVGHATETVEVTGEQSGVTTTTATISAVVSGTEMRELPLNGRDWASLATLEPGVAPVRTQMALASGANDRTIRGIGSQLTVGGTRPQQNNYRLDGISINDSSNGAPGSVLGANLGVDAIQEFSVITNNPSAEYGRSSGGIVNAITRSGSNALHGSAFEFFRNSALDARNYFDGPRVPPFKRNQFGGSLGGPILKDRTFFFGSYEGLRQSLSITQVDSVPSPNARNGQLTGGNVVVDPNVKPYLALYPLPNGAINGNFGTFTLVTAQVANEDFATGRVDHKLSSKDSLAGTYMFDTSTNSSPDPFDAVVMAAESRRQLVSLEETHTFSANFVNALRFGFSRVLSDGPKTLSAINAAAKDPSLGFLPGANVGKIQVPGLTQYPGGFGATGEYDFHFNSFQVYDDAFVTKGAHSLKFGVVIEHILANQEGRANPAGFFQFGSLANFLTNKPTSFTAAIPGLISPRDLRQTIFGTYAADDIHFRQNLTFNLGLRYEMATVPTEVGGKLSNLRNLTDAAPHLGSPYFSNPTLLNFEPRVGFSWDPFSTGKTAIRGALGMYDVLPLTYMFETLTILPAPFFAQGRVTGLAQGSFPTGAFPRLGATTFRYAHVDPDPSRAYVFQWNFNIQRELAPNLTALVGYIGSRGVHLPYRSEDVNMVLPTLTPQGYVWPSPVGSGKVLNPSLGQISALFWNNNSIYHSLQVRLSKRMAHGFQIGGSYTWSKSIDDGSSTLAGDALANAIGSPPFFDVRLTRGVSDFDITHNAVINYTWIIPAPSAFSGLAHWLTDGWQLGGIYQASTGEPFSALVGGDPLGVNNGIIFDYPDRIRGSGCDSLTNSGDPINYVRTQCFQFPNPTNRLGNAGRNILRGPGLSAFDFSVFKNNHIRRISEQFNVQFRVEAFNILNHSNFAPPLKNNAQNSACCVFFDQSGNVISSGKLDSTSTTSRQLQFALKLTW